MKKYSIGKISLLLTFLVFISFMNWVQVEADSECPSGKICITNPLEHKTFDDLIKAIIVFLGKLALVATALVIVLSGFYFVTAAGDPAKVTKAKQMILYALIGLAIVLAAEGIVALMGKVIKGK